MMIPRLLTLGFLAVAVVHGQEGGPAEPSADPIENDTNNSTTDKPEDYPTVPVDFCARDPVTNEKPCGDNQVCTQTEFGRNCNCRLGFAKNPDNQNTCEKPPKTVCPTPSPCQDPQEKCMPSDSNPKFTHKCVNVCETTKYKDWFQDCEYDASTDDAAVKISTSAIIIGSSTLAVLVMIIVLIIVIKKCRSKPASYEYERGNVDEPDEEDYATLKRLRNENANNKPQEVPMSNMPGRTQSQESWD